MNKQPLKAVCLILATTSLGSMPVAAQEEASWQEINALTADALVLPAYRDLNTATMALDEQSAAFCEQGDSTALAALRQSFHRSMDAWQALQHLQFGPVTYFNWNYRFHYWPDENGTGARQLRSLLAAEDSSVLDPERFAQQSVGVQGLSALESLIFASGSLSAFEQSPYRCRLLETISGNLADISSGVLQRWEEDFRQEIANPEDSNLYADAQDIGIDFMQTIMESLARIHDDKLQAPLGESFERSRGRRAESWQSQRSLENIRINLRALQSLFTGNYSEAATGYAAVLGSEDAARIAEGFEQALSGLEDLPDSLLAALEDEQAYARLERLLLQLETLDEDFETALKNSDLYLGFNSMDGD